MTLEHGAAARQVIDGALTCGHGVPQGVGAVEAVFSGESLAEGAVHALAISIAAPAKHKRSRELLGGSVSVAAHICGLVVRRRAEAEELPKSAACCGLAGGAFGV